MGGGRALSVLIPLSLFPTFSCARALSFLSISCACASLFPLSCPVCHSLTLSLSHFSRSLALLLSRSLALSLSCSLSLFLSLSCLSLSHSLFTLSFLYSHISPLFLLPLSLCFNVLANKQRCIQVRAPDFRKWWYTPDALRSSFQTSTQNSHQLIPNFAIHSQVVLHTTLCNADRDPVHRGKDGETMYCGLKKPIPGTDGFCGPTNGAQCTCCKSGVFQLAPIDSATPSRSQQVSSLSEYKFSR